MDDQTAAFVGIDVSKDFLDVAIGSPGGPEEVRFANNRKGIGDLVKRLKSLEPARVILEATGGYERPAVKALITAGFSVSIVNPRLVRDFARSSGKLAKTDKVDAQTLIRFGEVHRPRPTTLLDPTMERIRSLLVRRRQVSKMLTAEQVRLQGCDSAVKADIRRSIKRLQKDRDSLDKRIMTEVHQDDGLSRKVALLCSIKGVGEATAVRLVATLPELGQISNQQVAALVGVAPFAADSGRHRGVRSIAGGRAEVRQALYMPALTAKAYNPALASFYRRLRGKGKLPKVALVAVMRKLLIICNAVLSTGTPWAADYSSEEVRNGRRGVARVDGVDATALPQSTAACSRSALQTIEPVHAFHAQPAGPTT